MTVRRPLIEDNTERSHSTTLFSARIGYKFNKKLRLQLDMFDLLNRKASQVDYYYASHMPGEPAACINDVRFYPVEPRSLRLTLVANF